MQAKEKITIQCKDIIRELNLEYLSEDEQAEMISEMSDVIYEKIILKVIDKLNSDDVGSLTTMLDEEKYDDANAFLSDKISNFENIIDDEVTDFQEELIKFSK